MDTKRLGLICKVLAINRLRGVKLTGKSIFEKELEEWINGPVIKVDSGENLAHNKSVEIVL